MEIEFEDLPSEDEIFTPPPIFLQGDDDGPHDDIVHHQPPHLPPPGDAPGGAPGGQRKSGRPRKEPHKEGNVYPPGTSTDMDCHRKLPTTGTLGSAPNVSAKSNDTDDSDPAIAKMAAEGGASWYNYLLSKAIPYDEFPNPMNVRDWTSKDISKLPAEEQQAWWKAQFEELEALKNRNVYELTDLPPG